MNRILVGIVLVLALGACSPDDRTGDTERAAAVFATAIDTVVAETNHGAPASERPVFVVAAPGHEIGIETQAGVVERLEDLTVRFVDTPDEAIDESADGAPSLHGGLLLTLGPIGGGDREKTIRVDVYRRAGQITAYDLTLAQRHGDWVVTDQLERSS